MQSDKILDPIKLRRYAEVVRFGFSIGCITSISSRQELDGTINAIDRSKPKNIVFVKIPGLGIAFDVNWLIIASGVGFTAIYLLLYYSLSRERKNIKMLFKIASYEIISLARIYQFMSM